MRINPKLLKSDNIYSTDEIIIGKYLNKNLYRKVYHFNALTFSANYSFNHGISNFQKLINFQWNGWLSVVNKGYVLWDNITGRNITYDSNKIYFLNDAYQYPFQDVDITLEYIKTTD